MFGALGAEGGSDVGNDKQRHKNSKTEEGLVEKV